MVHWFSGHYHWLVVIYIVGNKVEGSPGQSIEVQTVYVDFL